MQDIVIMLKFICLVTLVWSSNAEELSADERAKVLEVHRKIREEVEPPASDMMLMDYSVELEKLAEKWFLNCTYPEYKDVEVVLQSGDKPEDASFEPASKFQEEKEGYRYESNTCTSLCGNYRRIIWATSRQVGCYRQRCEHSEIWTTPRYVMACFYKPVRQNSDERPYKSGSSCSGCPKGLGCYRKQCTELTTPGAVLYATEPPKDAVATDSSKTIKPLIPTQTRPSTATKKPLIQSQPATSTTKKSAVEKPQVTIPAEVPLELVQKPSGDAGKLQSEAAPFVTDQTTSQSQTTTSNSKRLMAVNALLSSFLAMIELA